MMKSHLISPGIERAAEDQRNTMSLAWRAWVTREDTSTTKTPPSMGDNLRKLFPGLSCVVCRQPHHGRAFSQPRLPCQKPGKSWEVFSLVSPLHLLTPPGDVTFWNRVWKQRHSRDQPLGPKWVLVFHSPTWLKCLILPPAAGMPECQSFPPARAPGSQSPIFGIFKALITPVLQKWKQLWCDEKDKSSWLFYDVNTNQMPALDRP